MHSLYYQSLDNLFLSSKVFFYKEMQKEFNGFPHRTIAITNIYLLYQKFIKILAQNAYTYIYIASLSDRLKVVVADA